MAAATRKFALYYLAIGKVTEAAAALRALAPTDRSAHEVDDDSSDDDQGHGEKKEKAEPLQWDVQQPAFAVCLPEDCEEEAAATEEANA